MYPVRACQIAHAIFFGKGGTMHRAARDALSDRAVWFLVGGVIFCVLLVLVLVFYHEKNKPDSPQALVAAGFNQLFNVKEWKPGMGKKPFMYHPAGFENPVWRPLPMRTSTPVYNQPTTGGGQQFGAVIR